MINTKKINKIGQEVSSTQASVFDEVVREGDIWTGDTWAGDIWAETRMKRKFSRRWGGEGNSMCETRGGSWFSVFWAERASVLE